jgi:uncharacterized protein (DUF427 family)
MPKATWNNAVLADSEQTEIVDGNHYFPIDSLNSEFFRNSDAHTVCGWKGTASYYDVVVDEQVNEQAAWYYPDPKDAAANLKGYVAFWKGVQVD